MRPVPLWRRYDRLLGSDPAEDVKDELRFHLETKVDDLVAPGWPEDARKEAERQFGNMLPVERVAERMGEHTDRQRRLTDHWSDALRDLRFTLRTLGATPALPSLPSSLSRSLSAQIPPSFQGKATEKNATTKHPYR